MIRFALLLSALAFAWVSPARADVVSVGTIGFEVREQVVVPASPAQAYVQFVKIGTWWSKDHTYSRDASNLELTPRAGGCWCERLVDGGSVKHMEVAAAQPGKQIVLIGGLGPLQTMGASGAMTVTFASEGAGTKVTLSYVVTGYSAQGFDKIAPAVDSVLSEQLKRYANLPVRP
jgi:hypothetical protein